MTERLVCAGEVGSIGAEAIRTLTARAIGGRAIADYAHEEAAWTPIEEGGWDYLGVDEESGGGGASLRDLTEMSVAWGESLLPLAFVETLWARRWSQVAREVPGQVSVAVALQRESSVGDQERQSNPAEWIEKVAIAPFGGASVPLLTSVGTASDSLVVPEDSNPDDFSPCLRLSLVSFVTSMPVEAAQELAVLWAAECVGGARRLLRMSVDYAKTREQFGQPIGRFQAIKHRLADMHMRTESADTAVIWASNEPGEALRVSEFAVGAAVQVAESAIQVHGGMGFTWELGLHYYLRSMLARRDMLRGLLRG